LNIVCFNKEKALAGGGAGDNDRETLELYAAESVGYYYAFNTVNGNN